MSKIEEENEEILFWHVPEYEKHERSKRWYIIAISVALVFFLFSFMTGNFLFAVIIIIVSLITVLHEGNVADNVEISLTSEGLVIGNKFYDYDEFENFSIVYKPRQEVKSLYFEFKSSIRHRISIPLMNMNPLIIRKFLIKYMQEDLDRTDQPISEAIAKFFKL